MLEYGGVLVCDRGFVVALPQLKTGSAGHDAAAGSACSAGRDFIMNTVVVARAEVLWRA